MMRQYELVERVAAYNPAVNEDLLNRAYVYAMKKHGTQKRASGDPYFSHPLEVAAIITELRMDDASVAVALLHDTIEDTSATRDEIDKLFGTEIGRLVDGLTKIDRLDLVSREARQAESLRKLLLAVADDVRVLLVKLADRLHNMRTIQYVPEAKRGRIAEETMEIYAPLAGRMGMQAVREELEELSFRTLNPEAYATIAAKLVDLRERTGGDIETIQVALEKRLQDSGINGEIRGRQKRPYSIFAKMQRKAVGFEQLSDIFGFRIFFHDVSDCYRALGAVHTEWRMVPGRFKDYISTPKQNGYQSLHTTVVGPGKQRVELQLRTYAMDRIAEYGIAAHPLYKDGIAADRDRLARESSAYAWLRQTVEHIAHGDAPEEFLENTKLELFQDQVFCFTPKGRLIALPRGATPIDFAYAVHTDIGDTCVGAKVNGKLTPLVTPLENGDEVEIVRSEAQRPPPAWESVVVTGKARAAIRRATRAHVRKQYAGLGRHTLHRAFERLEEPWSEARLKEHVGHFGFEDVEDLLAAVGRGQVNAEAVMNSVFPERMVATQAGTRTNTWHDTARASLGFSLDEEGRRGAHDDNALPIRGASGDMPIRFDPEGGAVPGDRIVGILTPGEGITIYPIHSPALTEFENEPDRWVDVRWDIPGGSAERFPARIRVSTLNEPGSLAEIADSIGRSDGNIDNLRMLQRRRDFTELEIDLEVWNLKHLNHIMRNLRAKSVVSGVVRVNG
ncbi:bifunctional (p)ppGpp synthetase/guanosine-3',5'-bis(diphosphate) 3'-pyrophosphohydrolase [Afifella sp. JA880]|uniref:RelA/SpoT family protein n=1 Tax=Afifella sp. JA880 TaxID=2975280 RepID=UPI0021BB36D4|nr:bifunctional (p)ppGpp synthetase/guanosine-3',5'-bis(diphosphate) 3'-pyrophosphohydrolase [Afifella sp. JA880]MCT8267661.1 bifunctional (p)ppGpp synthetase/guanosine-3',5'-bis(diphosphate) 3'-pyrophosphohydrolase [Afifella sp. JA880]